MPLFRTYFFIRSARLIDIIIYFLYYIILNRCNRSRISIEDCTIAIRIFCIVHILMAE